MKKFFETKTGLFIITVLALIGGIFLLIIHRYFIGGWLMVLSAVTFITALTKLKKKN